jgi:hypothetical protein
MGLYLWSNRADRMLVFFGLAALAGFASNVKITFQFSSRYDFVFLPLLLLSVSPAMRLTWHLPIRLAVGAAAGLLSLFSYFAAAG